MWINLVNIYNSDRYQEGLWSIASCIKHLNIVLEALEVFIFAQSTEWFVLYLFLNVLPVTSLLNAVWQSTAIIKTAVNDGK
jgi:hypothetical protein